MQGQESGIDSFREAIDNIGQGSDSSSADMNHQSPFNSMIPPVESRWSSYASSGETCVNAGTSEPSGSAPRNQANDEGAKIEHGRLSPYGSHHTVGSVTEEILFPGRAIISLGGNQVNGPSFSQGSSSNHMRQHVNLNAGYVGSSSNGEQGIGASLGPNLYLSSRLETESSTATSSDIVGTSAGSSGCIAGEADGSTGSLGNWGLSCKRKALEATSGQSCSGGSSSSYLQPENCLWHNGPARYNPSSSLRLSAPSGSSQEQQIPRPGIPAGTVATDAFPSSSATESGESPPRQVGSETNSGSHHESIPFNLASAGSSGRYSRRPAPFGDPSGLRSTAAVGANLGAPQSQSHNLHVPGFSGNLHNFPWNGASNSRGGTMTSSFSFGERATDIREEANLRSIPRTNVDHAMFVPANEMRNTAHDPTSSSLASGNLSTSLGIPASTRIASTSSNPPLPAPAWIPHHNSPSQSRQRTLEFAPWSLFPSIDSQPVGHGGNSDPLPPGPSSTRDTIMSSGRNNQNRQQPYLRSSFLTDRQGEDALSISNSLRVLSADIEGRRQLISEIRQVLHAMRRGENLQFEDYMLFDPFMYHGMAEMHDRHRDMRLDVDNMSYEELLALEERIGDVSTGLSEATILKLMKQRKYESIVESTPDTEPCCICQEEFADGDDVGALDCGHDFHTDCVKQWLMQKNLCPICKTTGLLT